MITKTPGFAQREDSSVAKLSKLPVVLLLSTLVLLSTPSSASAYKRLPHKWPSAVLKVHITQAYSTAYYWQLGELRWNSTSTPVNFTEATTAKINLTGIDQSSTSYDGLTSCSASGGIATYCGAWINHYYLKGYSQNKAAGVAAHELGHVLGLDHTSGCVLMYAYSDYRDSCGANSPKADDINGINAIY
jgi:predicted Zn-dependent protease